MISQFKDTVTWETIQSGLRVLRLCGPATQERPQIALLHLSKDLYQDFQKNPSAFVNRYHIFTQDVRPRARCIRMELAPKSYVNSWMITGTHHQGSKFEYASSPAEEVHPARLRKQKAAA